jgi:hypothetical protein
VGDDLVCIIRKDEIGECITLSFSGTNPVTRFLGRAIGWKGMVNRVKPTDLEESQDVRTLTSGNLEWNEAAKGIKGHRGGRGAGNKHCTTRYGP